MQIELHEMHITKLAVHTAFSESDSLNSIVEDTALEQSLLKSKTQYILRILLTWEMQLHSGDLEKVTAEITGKQIMKCLPGYRNKPLESIKDTVIRSYADLQNEVALGAKNTF